MPLDDSTIAVLNELLAERDKLLLAHYAEAIRLDLLKTEQDRTRTSLGQIADFG